VNSTSENGKAEKSQSLILAVFASAVVDDHGEEIRSPLTTGNSFVFRSHPKIVTELKSVHPQLNLCRKFAGRQVVGEQSL
jgi:hypothetical protein